MTEFITSGSVLGPRGDQYSNRDQDIVYRIAVTLKDREARFHPMTVQNMQAFVRVAGMLYEMSKSLASIEERRFPKKSTDDWLRTITGIQFQFTMSYDVTNENILDTEVVHDKVEKIEEKNRKDGEIQITIEAGKED